jgi:hypothetical protein
MGLRIVMGFLAAPFAAAIAVVATSSITHGVSGAEEFAVSVLVWSFFAASFMVAIALPAFLVLRRYGHLRWWSALSTGLLVGAVGAVSLIGRHTSDVVLPTIAGGIGGLVFWIIASNALRPNKSLERTRDR